MLNLQTGDKKPMTPFFQFSADERPKVKAAKPCTYTY
jgi:hypothetical protein